MKTELGTRTVRLFATCLIDAFRPDVGQAAVQVLEQAGVEVQFPSSQTCCGQFVFNAGYRQQAAVLARHFVSVFQDESTPIVALSGSCAAMVVHEYPTLVIDGVAAGETASWAAAARAVGGHVVEFSQWVAAHLTPSGAAASAPRCLALHQGCHMRRVLGENAEPAQVLSRHGIEIQELVDADQCCGFGGTYSMTEWAVSTALGDAKIAALEEAGRRGAMGLVSADLGCLLHLQGRMRRRGLSWPVYHVAEVLREAMQPQGGE
ncbi:MAG: (Fe-S)-binding protein [Sulfobacillus acidophilus]|uniref:(Fe-S)-binding protein n=1 Tax=Sulfobacillus acidophilus TaxID=53633 RepID=A0A2T2WJF9_9FIRM|nr:MAG: (Fe-S)-binding protein [Sulfobacillus acidophilus]